MFSALSARKEVHNPEVKVFMWASSSCDPIPGFSSRILLSSLEMSVAIRSRSCSSRIKTLHFFPKYSMHSKNLVVSAEYWHTWRYLQNFLFEPFSAMVYVNMPCVRAMMPLSLRYCSFVHCFLDCLATSFKIIFVFRAFRSSPQAHNKKMLVDGPIRFSVWPASEPWYHPQQWWSCHTGWPTITVIRTSLRSVARAGVVGCKYRWWAEKLWHFLSYPMPCTMLQQSFKVARRNHLNCLWRTNIENSHVTSR